MPRTYGITTARGYGHPHQQARKAALTHLRANPGQPCWRCGTPLYYEQRHLIDLGHDDHDRSLYRGLECRSCNRATTGRHHPPTTSEPW